MGRGTLTAVLVVLLVAGTTVGAAASAGIKSVEITNAEDRDGDGAVSSFDLLIRADTSCIGCNDESDDDPQIEPYFVVTVSGEAGNDVEFDPVEVEANDNLEEIYPIPNEVLQEFDTQTLTIQVVLWDRDPLFDDEIDDTTIRVEYETVADDPTPTPAPTATPTPTATSTPTDTPTPTATSTPTDTPTPTATPTQMATPQPNDGESNGGQEQANGGDSGGESQDEGFNPMIIVGAGLITLAGSIVVAAKELSGGE